MVCDNSRSVNACESQPPMKTYNIEIKEHRDRNQIYFVVSAALGPLGSIITEGKNLRDACRNLIEALDLTLEASKKTKGDVIEERDN